ncbi:MAG: plasmid pRiA4b ORF-3 family protein [Bacteroidetes bacterium]|nr:plasmid pRiA4b ORF-3 family protein [Bacteroidota bacterium]
MILLFRILSDEDQEFYRDLVIDGSDTFLDFHKVLQENLGYDPTQLASFFITSKSWEKEQEITLIDMNQDSGIETLTMGEVTLDEYLSEVSQRMIYVFDFFSERAFFMELIEDADQVSPRETPFIAQSQGDPPQQLAIDLLQGDQGGESDIDSYDDPDDMGEDDLRIDDLDPDLFGSGNPEDY